MPSRRIFKREALPVKSEPQRIPAREGLTLRISYDECKTWNEGKVLYDGPSAYSDLCVSPDMSICCLYERGKKHSYEEITFARFTLEWLTNGADSTRRKP